MTKEFKGDLILEENTIFEESIIVLGNIKGKDNQKFDLKIDGDIKAWNIKKVFDYDIFGCPEELKGKIGDFFG